MLPSSDSAIGYTNSGTTYRVMLTLTLTLYLYLGGKVSELATSDADIDRRIGLATKVTRGLTSIWRSNDICTITKVRSYKTYVLAVLLYNSETWTLKEAQIRRLQVFEMTVLRRIRGVTKRDRRRKNVDIRKELGVTRDVVNEVYTAQTTLVIW